MFAAALALLSLTASASLQGLESAWTWARPAAARTAQSLAWPEDVPLKDFKRLGQSRIFMLKHRRRLPAKIVQATPEEIIAGKLNVEVGVEVEGTVTWAHKAVDRDYTFDFGDLHMEITPEWRKFHPKMSLPKIGQRVRVRGWTYYDVFHKIENEEGEEALRHWDRKTLWEVHPVLAVTIIGVRP